MHTEPAVAYRGKQDYMGIRTQVAMRRLKAAIPRLLDEVFAWLEEREVGPAGPPIVRYHVIDMKGTLDVEMGVPVARAMPDDGRVAAGVLPAGRYASLVFTGVKNGVKANGVLLEWGAQQGLTWDTFEADGGDGFGARFESTLTHPDEEPDTAKWKIEVAIRLADDPAP